MKYIAIIDTDDYKDFEFFEDGNGKYMAVKDAGATANGGWMPLYFTECEQEQKTGHWVEYTEPNWETAYKCSECGSHSGWKQNYCPNCGSRMAASEVSE